MDEQATLAAHFVVHHWSVPYGEHLRIVGTNPALGGWDPTAGLLLEWAEGDDWVGETALPSGTLGFKVSYNF